MYFIKWKRGFQHRNIKIIYWVLCWFACSQLPHCFITTIFNIECFCKSWWIITCPLEFDVQFKTRGGGSGGMESSSLISEMLSGGEGLSSRHSSVAWRVVIHALLRWKIIILSYGLSNWMVWLQMEAIDTLNNLHV